MTRISIAALVILGAALVGGARAEIPQGPVTLKSRVTVNDDVVRLGDIFTNLAGKAKIAVAYAPRPGRRTILDVVWLAQLARAYGLPWRARSRFDRVTIERASRQIHRQRIAEQIKTALRARGVEGDYRIRFDNRALAV